MYLRELLQRKSLSEREWFVSECETNFEKTMAEYNIRDGVEYSGADQIKRFAKANADKNQRYLDITTVYDGSSLKGQRVLITGAEQGLGLELVKEILLQGGHAIQAGRTSSPDLDALATANPGGVTIITGIDVCKDDSMAKMVAETKEGVDIVINCAGEANYDQHPPPNTHTPLMHIAAATANHPLL